jgi:hypothetical protein
MLAASHTLVLTARGSGWINIPHFSLTFQPILPLSARRHAIRIRKEGLMEQDHRAEVDDEELRAVRS